jgi:hypothetical protein
MAEMVDTPGRDRSLVRINRLQRGFSWSVVVTADDNTDEALQEAQERAVAITRQLEEELGRPNSETEVPF